VFFTQHAIERFRQRYAPGFTHAAALRELQTLALSARPMREKAPGGKLRYVISDGEPITLVCIRNPRGTGDRIVCITVLPKGETEDDPES